MTEPLTNPNEKLEEKTKKIIFSGTAHKKGRILISGNEAIVRGLLESGVGFGASYPGTPVSEVGDLLYEWSKLPQSDPFIFDYAINEKIALEEAIGAAWTGVRSVAIFKHLGMNVAADALHSIMYSGIGGKDGAGMVIIVGGDPQSTSSTNAEDVRLYSKHTHLPILFPSSVNELHKFVKLGFELSEVIDLPIMIYTTPKLSFSTSTIYPEQLQSINVKPLIKKNEPQLPHFKRDMNRYINAIHFAVNNQKKLLRKINLLEVSLVHEQLGHIIYNWGGDGKSHRSLDHEGNIGALLKKIENSSESINQDNIKVESNNKNSVDAQIHYNDLAIISGGLPYSLTAEILSNLNLLDKIPLLKINVIYPINLGIILDFIRKYKPKKLMIIEELEPFIEDSVKSILFDNNIIIPIIGKSVFPRYGELDPQTIKFTIKNILKIKSNENIKNFNLEYKEYIKTVPIREPTFCPGCSHRNVFYSLRKVADQLKKSRNIDIVFGGDIGCYTMGMSSPYSAMDWLISMGAGIGIANGVGKILNRFGNEEQQVVALIGDSTLFHSGLQGLLNVLKENLDITIIILNNYYVAMTGHQPTLTTPNPRNIWDPNVGFKYEQLRLDTFLRHSGIIGIKTVNGKKIPEMIKLFEKVIGYGTESERKAESATNVIVVNSECALMVKKRAKKIWQLPRGVLRGPELYIRINDNCPQCNICYADFGCTAIRYVTDENSRTGVKYYIDEGLCMREYCKSCLDICPNSCIDKIMINPKIWDKTDKQKE